MYSRGATHQFTGALVEADFCLLEAKVGVPSANTTNLSQSKHDLALTQDVGVHHTKDVLEVLWQNHGSPEM